MIYNSRKYCIRQADSLDSTAFHCFLNNKGNVPWNSNRDYFLLTYEGNKPRCIYGEEVFTHKEILAKKKDPNDPFYDPDVTEGL